MRDFQVGDVAVTSEGDILCVTKMVPVFSDTAGVEFALADEEIQSDMVIAGDEVFKENYNDELFNFFADAAREDIIDCCTKEIAAGKYPIEALRVYSIQLVAYDSIKAIAAGDGEYNDFENIRNAFDAESDLYQSIFNSCDTFGADIDDEDDEDDEDEDS